MSEPFEAATISALRKISHWNVTWWGAFGDGTTNDTAAFVAAIAAVVARGGGCLFIPAGMYILSPTIAIPPGVTILGAGRDYTTLLFPVLGTGVSAFEVQVGRAQFYGVHIQGPAGGVYEPNERLIYAHGADTLHRLDGITIRNCEFSHSGSYAVWLEFTDSADVGRNVIHNCGYCGVLTVSCNDFYIAQNTIHTIAPGTGGTLTNNYGIAISHNNEGWPGTRKAQPFSSNGWVVDNDVSNIEWTGIDSHGGIRIIVERNRVRDCGYGIAIASGSGDASNYAGYDNQILCNAVYGGTRANRYQGGITINGGSTEAQRHCLVQGNIVVGYGISGNPNSAAILAADTHGIIISNNQIRDFGNNGVLFAGSMADAIVEGNIFGNTIDRTSNAVLASVSSGTLLVRGNIVTADGGTACGIGLRAETLTSPPICSDNEFSACTDIPYYVPTPNALRGTDIQPFVRPTNGATTINVSGRGPKFVVEFLYSGPAFVTDLTGAVNGQEAMLLNYNSSSITFVHNASLNRLAGGVDCVVPQYGTLTLVRYGTVWIEKCRSITNG